MYTGLGPDNVEDYKLAKTSIRKLERDFTVMTKISSSVAKLHHDYQASYVIKAHMLSSNNYLITI